MDDLVSAFTPDGVLEVRGMAPARGREAIRAMLSDVAAAPAAIPETTRIVRHALTGIRFTEVTPQRVAVASYFSVITEIGLDHCGRYRDEFVPVGPQWLIAHRFVCTDWAAPDSTMVG